ncbi:MAG: sensor histidine kinase [Chitinophagaceae bacterium]
MKVQHSGQAVQKRHGGKLLFYHAIAWSIFIVYELSLLYVLSGYNLNYNIWWAFIFPYIINISFFYAAVALIGWSVKKGKWWPILLAGGYFCLISVGHFLMILNNWVFLSKGEDLITYATKSMDAIAHARHIWRFLYFSLFSGAFWYTRRFFQNLQKLRETEATVFRQEQARADMEVKLVKTHNAFLQSQVNPHLIFNALNFIQNEVREASPEAAESVITLADIMRYSLNGTKEDGNVLLEEELEQIGNLIRINQARFSNRLHLQLKITGDITGAHIMPLTLVPLVENMFKYAELMDEHEPARILVKVENGTLIFETLNRKKKTIQYKTPGIGISNLRERLLARYPNRFTLESMDKGDHFHVKMEITL